MTDVVFRKMRFDVDETVPFQWNPTNPASGLMANMISFIAVGFERYIVLAVKQALPDISDPDLRAEAEVFLAQESQHSAAHRRHVNGLIAQYPKLADVLDDFEADPEVRAVLVRGAGGNFCSGGDLAPDRGPGAGGS